MREDGGREKAKEVVTSLYLIPATCQALQQTQALLTSCMTLDHLGRQADCSGSPDLLNITVLTWVESGFGSTSAFMERGVLVVFANRLFTPLMVPLGVASPRSSPRLLSASCVALCVGDSTDRHTQPFQLPSITCRSKWEAGMADFQSSPACRPQYWLWKLSVPL